MKRSVLPVLRGGRVLGVLGCVALVAACSGCAAPPRAQLPVSPWGSQYLHRWEPPEVHQIESTKATIAVVTPSLERDSSFAARTSYAKVASGLEKSLAVDLDKAIVAKGMTTTGPFESMDLMTYPDKKNADLILRLNFFLNTQERLLSPTWTERGEWAVNTAEVRVDGWVVIYLLEPLSGEKLFVKKVEIEEESERAEIYCDWVQEKGRGMFPDTTNPRYDGRPDAVANILNRMYPKIMKSVWIYVNPEEVKLLKDVAGEIRQMKRY